MDKMYIIGSGFTKAFCKEAPTIDEMFNDIKDDELSDYVKSLRQNLQIESNQEILSVILDDRRFQRLKKLFNNKIINKDAKLVYQL